MRILLPVMETPGGYSHIGTPFTWTAGVTNNNAFVSTGKEIVLARNTHATLAQTLIVRSVPDPFGRIRDITLSIAVGAFVVLGPFPIVGWQQADGRINLDPADPSIQFLILRIRE